MLMSSGGKNYFPELTGIRMVAMYGIYNCHFNLIDPAVWGNTLYRLGQEMHLGVPVFYVLSGFLIYYLYGYKLKRITLPWGLEYAKNRFARIYPVYFILLTITYLWEGFPDSTRETLVTYTLTQALFPDLVHAGISQAWTLTIEETFYFSAPFIFLAAMRWGLLVPCIGIFCLGIFLVTVDFPFNPYYQNASHVFGRTLCGMIGCFGFGILLGKIVRRHSDGLPKRKRPVLTYTAVAFMLAIMLVQTRLAEQAEAWNPGSDMVRGSEHPVGYFLSYFVFPGFVVMWFWGMMTEASAVRRLLGLPLVVLLGRSSYCFYLMHYGVVSTWLEEFVTHNHLGQILLLTLLSVLMLKVIEHPANQYIKFLGRPPKSAEDPFSGRLDRKTLAYVWIYVATLAVQIVPLSFITQHDAATAYTLLAVGGWWPSMMVALFAAAGMVFLAGALQAPTGSVIDGSIRGRKFSLAALAAVAWLMVGETTHWGGQFFVGEDAVPASSAMGVSRAGMIMLPAIGASISTSIVNVLAVVLCAYIGVGALVSAYFPAGRQAANRIGIPLASPQLGIVLGGGLVWYLGVDRIEETFVVVLGIVMLVLAVEVTLAAARNDSVRGTVRLGPILAACAVAVLLFGASIATGQPEADPRVQATRLSHIAEKKLLEGDLSGSLEAAEAAVRLWPDDVDGQFWLGVGHLEQGDLTRAAKAFMRTIELDPTIADAHANLGIIRLRQRRLEDAYYHLQDAISINGRNPDAHNNLGVVLEQLGEYEMAITEYEIALRLAPQLKNAQENVKRARERLNATR